MPKYFETIETNALCRAGGNGPFHPTQIMGLGFVGDNDSMLDLACGGCTTTECLVKMFPHKNVDYIGSDFVEKHVKNCQKQYPQFKWKVQDAMNLDMEDESVDVVWARHIVEHLPSFEKAVDEFLRVAKKRVIINLFTPLTDKKEHKITHVSDKGVVYEEYFNLYSREKVFKYLSEISRLGYQNRVIENVGIKGRANDTIIIIFK